MKHTLPVIVIAGPTAIGKTAVAIELARSIDAEIISADSRQIYRLLDIGTGKPTTEELAAAPHHFIDILDPRQEYSAGQFSRAARARVDEIRSRGKNVIVAGGSGMYIEAFLYGFFAAEIRDKKLQLRLKKRAQSEGSEALYRELQQVDPERASELHAEDAHRIVRALEVFLSSGMKLSELRKQPRVPAPFSFQLFGLYPAERQELYDKISLRVDHMLVQGLLDEVRSLLAQGISPLCNAMLTVGYREPLQWLRGGYTYPEMVEKIKQHSRNYAKKQLTWFRRYREMNWIAVQAGETPHSVAAKIEQSVMRVAV